VHSDEGKKGQQTGENKRATFEDGQDDDRQEDESGEKA